MNLVKVVFLFCLLVFLSFSCSSDDKDPEVVFNSLVAGTTDLYTEDKTTITVDGTGYTDSNLTTSNPNVKISKVTSTTFEVSSTKAISTTIYAELKNNSFNKMKSITINFAEHGVKNFNTVEGITKNLDKIEKILKLLGEPQDKIDSFNGLTTNWHYPQKGLTVIVDKKNNMAIAFNLFSNNYYYTSNENIAITYSNYPYELGNGWFLNNTNTTMDMVVEKLGTPTIKNTSLTSSTNRGYQFSSSRLWFRFNSESEDIYKGKKVTLMTIY